MAVETLRSDQVISIEFPNLLPIEEQRNKVRDIPVALIIPPSIFLTQKVFPELGILKVAASLRQNGNRVEVLDLTDVGNYEEVLNDYLATTDIRTFGITATTPHIPSAMKIGKAIKEAHSDSRTILGGPHATLTYSAHKHDVNSGERRRVTEVFEQLTNTFDTIVAGDGELATFYAIASDADRVIDASSRHSQLFLQRGTLEVHPYPARDLINLESYVYYIEDDEVKFRAASVIAQLGCPFECGFCTGRGSDYLRLTRTRDVADVIKEVREVVDMSENWVEPIRGIMFYDDELNVSPMALENLCKGLIELQKEMGIEMRFRGFIKAELFTAEQANLMYQAGFRVLLTGVESGSDEILKTMRKHTSRKINSRCVSIAHDAGLRVKALMSIGHPGESRETIAESVEWVKSNLRVGDDVDWTKITLYVGAPYSDDAVYVPEANVWLYTESKTGNRLWSEQVDYSVVEEVYKGIPGEYVSHSWTDFLTSTELVELRDHAEKVTREALGLPPILAVPPRHYDHSMGQIVPSDILRSSN